MIKGVPYDAEIEYLESTGTQWIDMDVMLPVIGLKATIGCSFPSLAPSDIPIVTRPYTRGFSLLITAGTPNNYFWLYNDNGGRFVRNDITFVADSRYDLETILRPNGATLSVNGSSQSATFTPTASTDNIWIFRQSNKYTIGRIFECKLYSEDTLVRDFIPVRVGTVGYMYDRVTRRLFGNQGTGDFVLGPDKAYPVMSIHRYPSASGGIALGKMGAGQRMMRSFSAKDYVQDGLVAMWDAEAAPDGKDITGNGYDLTLQGVSVVDKAFVFNGSSYAYLTSQTLCNAVRDIRAVAKFSENESGMVCQCGYKTNLNFGNQLAWHKTIGLITTSTGAAAGPRKSFPLAYSYASSDFSCHLSAPTVGIEGAVFNGESLSLSVVNSNGGSDSGIVILGAAAYGLLGSGYLLRGHIRNVGLYSRALTAAEIAHNYNIDKLRFNLP